MTAKEMEAQLVEWLATRPDPTPAQRVEYVKLWVKWLEAKGVPRPTYAEGW